MKTTALCFAFAALVVSGCAAHSDETGSAVQTSEEAITGTSVQYFRVVAQDNRKCAFPMCGGVFVSRVNFEQTKCIDGTWQDRCYVSELDFGSLVLPPAQNIKLDGEARGGHVVIRGKFAAKKYGATKGTVLAATEAWQAESESTPSGTFYAVRDSGIVCKTSPCPTIHQAKLNSTSSRNVTGLDLSGAGLNSKQLGGVFASLDGDGVLVAGSDVVVPKAGPAGDGTNLVATAVYAAVKAQTGYCQFDTECTMTPYSKAVASKADCYCRMCGDATDVTAAADNEADFQHYCASSKTVCPQVKCAYREARCIENKCTAVVPN
jgi:hypothetical protein